MKVPLLTSTRSRLLLPSPTFSDEMARASCLGRRQVAPTSLADERLKRLLDAKPAQVSKWFDKAVRYGVVPETPIVNHIIGEADEGGSRAGICL